jgi:hypothetical protein
VWCWKLGGERESEAVAGSAGREESKGGGFHAVHFRCCQLNRGLCQVSQLVGGGDRVDDRLFELSKLLF